MNKPNSGTWCFIINPHAGGGKAIRQWKELQTRLNQHSVRFEYYVTTSSIQVREIANSHAKIGVRQFVAIGGDGTLNDLLQGLLQSGIALNLFTLTVVPWGTGNDWARFHAIPSPPKQWLRFFLRAYREPHDVGIAHYGEAYKRHHAFINIAGTGLDSHIIEQMGAAGGKSFRYYLTLLKSLYGYSAQPTTVTVDPPKNDTDHYPDTTTKHHAALITMACIGRYGGSGMIFAPKANCQDGLLDVLSITDMSFWRRLFSTPYLLNGKIHHRPEALYQQAKAVTITTGSSAYFQCDGELIAKLPVKFSLYPEQINTLAHERLFDG